MRARPLSFRLVIAGAAVAGAAVAFSGLVALAQIPGDIRWNVEAHETQDGLVQFGLTRRTPTSVWNNSHSVPLSTLAGLSAEQLNSATPQKVSFRITRDAGRLDCQGEAQGGEGDGDCAFTESQEFAQLLRQRGMGQADRGQLFRMALQDIGRAYLDELARQRYATPSVDELARAGEHGAGLKYLSEMGAAGYRLGRVDALVRTRDHGVTPRYVAELKAAGYANLSADALVRLRDHGVSAKWLGIIQAAGYGGLPIEDLVRMRDHGVSAEYVGGLQRAGYERLSAEELIRLRDHGVTAGYVQELVDMGYRGLTPDELVRMRDHGVSTGFVRRVVDAGERLSADQLIELRDRGETYAARR